jgi:hypothetical protein
MKATMWMILMIEISMNIQTTLKQMILISLLVSGTFAWVDMHYWSVAAWMSDAKFDVVIQQNHLSIFYQIWTYDCIVW